MNCKDNIDKDVHKWCKTVEYVKQEDGTLKSVDIVMCEICGVKDDDKLFEIKN